MLITVDRPINKDTEMHPLVRWQFRGGIEEKDRKAFLFTNVTDSRGRHYDIPVVVGAIAANEEIYRIGMGVPLDQIDATWQKAMAAPIKPTLVEDAPCQEIVITGDDLLKPGNGLDGIPVPISTPGWDNGPYTTLSQYITKDPDTGIQNMGNYRGQVKSPTRLGMNPSLELRPGIYVHWEKYRKRGEKMAAAVVLGCPPAVAFTSAQKCPETPMNSKLRAVSSARRSTSCARRRSTCSFRPKPRSSSRVTSRPRTSSRKRRSASRTVT